MTVLQDGAATRSFYRTTSRRVSVGGKGVTGKTASSKIGRAGGKAAVCSTSWREGGSGGWQGAPDHVLYE